MTTRATYKFEASDHRDAVTFYIHTDGYEEGAAEYFKEACLFKNARGGMAEAFVRANDRAEFTWGHDRHSDTEYRYTLSRNDHLTAEKRTFTETDQFGHTNWKGVWNGPLAKFIEAKAGVKLLHIPGQWLDLDMANALLLDRLEATNQNIQKGQTGNGSHNCCDAWRLLVLMVDCFGPSSVIATALEAIDSADRYFVVGFGWCDQLSLSKEDALVRWQASFREGRERIVRLLQEFQTPA